MATLTVTTAQAGILTTTIALAGDLANGAGELHLAMRSALSARRVRRLLARANGRRDARRVRMPRAYRVVVDLRAVTSLGVAGLGLVYGAFRGAPWGSEVFYQAGPWARTLALVLGRSGNGRLGYGTPAVDPWAIAA